MRYLSKFNGFLDAFIQKGAYSGFFEYLVKYLMLCGVGINIFILINFLYG